jgi:hypothetical protein
MNCEGVKMTERNLIKRDVNIGFSEPWKLAEELEKENLIGAVIDAGTSMNRHYGNKDACLVIRLKKSFLFDGLECKYFVVSPRHEGTSFKDLMDGNKINCSFLRITKEQADSDNPFDTSWWRGGGGFIASVKLS